MNWVAGKNNAGLKNNKSGSKSGNVHRAEASTSRSRGGERSSGSAIGYSYPSVDKQVCYAAKSFYLCTFFVFYSMERK